MAWARSIGVILVAPIMVALGGCPGTTSGTIDGGPHGSDGGDDMDAGTGGLILHFAVDPSPLPQTFHGDTTIESVSLRLADVRVVGDAAPGDERTSRAQVALDWTDSSHPDDVAFMSAPPGLYSRVEFRFDGAADHAVSIHGKVRLMDGQDHDFTINDDTSDALGFDVDGVSLGTKDAITIDVTTDLQHISDACDWSTVIPDGEGELIIESGSPQMAAVHAAILTAFSAKKH